VNNLTFVRGARDSDTLDPVSRTILERAPGTSVFDPVVCELAYRWFCPPGGTILDPFAGGSVRGVVASKLGRQYVGIELRREQIAANRAQADEICGEPMPVWIEGDAREAARLVRGIEADFVFSCPPYADLEVYSDDPRDLSNMPYDEFRAGLAEAVRQSVGMLRPHRFAAMVIGDVRGPDGFYRGLPWHLIQIFEDAGARLLNEFILVTVVGSLPIRAGRAFAATRKAGKTHQQLLVFCNGDPAEAARAVGEVEFGDLPVDAAEEVPE
jgi:DNA modification methylase